MSKVIYTIPFLIMLFLVAATDSRSQDKNNLAAEISMENSEVDTNFQNNLFKLYQNEETESNGVTVIKFDLTEEAIVTLNVSDINGNVVETLIDGEMMPGTYCVHFKPLNKEALKDMSYKIEVNGVSETRKMVGK